MFFSPFPASAAKLDRVSAVSEAKSVASVCVGILDGEQWKRRPVGDGCPQRGS